MAATVRKLLLGLPDLDGVDASLLKLQGTFSSCPLPSVADEVKLGEYQKGQQLGLSARARNALAPLAPP